MTKSRNNRWAGKLLALAVLILAAAYPAYAYIDPGTGSFIVQLLLAGFFTLVFMLKKVRAQIKNFISGMFSGKHDEKQK